MLTMECRLPRGRDERCKAGCAAGPGETITSDAAVGRPRAARCNRGDAGDGVIRWCFTTASR
jgi:hypothetical protein